MKDLDFSCSSLAKTEFKLNLQKNNYSEKARIGKQSEGSTLCLQTKLNFINFEIECSQNVFRLN